MRELNGADGKEGATGLCFIELHGLDAPQDGRTALIEAALGGHVAVLDELLDRGADLEAKDMVSPRCGRMEPPRKSHFGFTNA